MYFEFSGYGETTAAHVADFELELVDEGTRALVAEVEAAAAEQGDQAELVSVGAGHVALANANHETSLGFEGSFQTM